MKPCMIFYRILTEILSFLKRERYLLLVPELFMTFLRSEKLRNGHEIHRIR
jgi:hypothetical protein